MDCSAFINWDEGKFDSVHEQPVVFRSLVSTLKLQPAPDASLEGKAVRFLKSVGSHTRQSPDAFLSNFASFAGGSLTDFVQIISLLSKADLIPQVINTLNPLSLSLTEAVDIHTHLVNSVDTFVRLATPYCLEQLGIEDRNEQQAVHETVFTQVVVPSEKFIWHLCANRYSIVDGELSETFLTLLTRILQISPYYQPTKNFVFYMPIVLTIPSCLTFFENDHSIYNCLYSLVGIQQEWIKRRRSKRQMQTKVQRMLRMEGIDDVIEGELGNDKHEEGYFLVVKSSEWSNQLGMNLQQRQ
ncbi:hypothetical protein BLNAU_10761 [Blattamonas nauphoetae]|uniref:Uncharacterized protein n=1 Tax=Blattamonas nauphoetae TaxID=2049346 RepID=A0ABQ9XPB2_9EUKA|nr:hypothetical protein BLNAU_10761 [Blattamonas nauphoetae]